MFPTGGAPAWSPAYFGADLLFWFRAYVDYSPGLWVDYGPGGYDLEQVTGAKQPTVTAADPTFNGFDSLHFASGSLATMATPPIDFGIAEIFAILKIQSGGRLWNHDASVAHAVYMTASVQGFHGNGAGTYQFVGASTLYDPASGRRVISHRTGGDITDHDLAVDGTSVVDAVVRDDGPILTTVSAPFYLGSYQDAAEYVDMDIVELFGVRDRITTPEERTAIDTYSGIYAP